MADTPVNLEHTRSGRVRPVCEFCARRGRAVVPDERGRVGILGLAQGWAVAPYPPDFQHRDGSTGDLFTCPDCDKRLSRGEALRTRRGGTSWRVEPDVEREAALRVADRAQAAPGEADAMD